MADETTISILAPAVPCVPVIVTPVVYTGEPLADVENLKGCVDRELSERSKVYVKPSFSVIAGLVVPSKKNLPPAAVTA